MPTAAELGYSGCQQRSKWEQRLRMQYEIWGIFLILLVLGYFLGRRFREIDRRLSRLETADNDWPSSG